MYILTLQSLSSSARLLSEQIKEISGKKLEVFYEPQREPPSIRWGNSRGTYERDTQFNSSRGIRFCGNKLAWSNLMSTLDVPFVELNYRSPEKFPIVIRTLLNSSEGRGIVIVKNKEEFEIYKNNYWSYWYNFQYELGVHMLGGTVQKVFKKIWNLEESEPEFPIRNLSKGYSFKRVRPESFSRLHPFVSSFYDEFDLEFCRMDVGWDQDSHCYRLIEVNTAPSLSNNENTLELYANFLAERIF